MYARRAHTSSLIIIYIDNDDDDRSLTRSVLIDTENVNARAYVGVSQPFSLKSNHLDEDF